MKFPTGGREEDIKGLRELHLAVKHLAEIKSKMQRVSIRKYELLYRYGESYACYSFAPWVPLTSTRGLPFQIKDGLERGGLIRSPDGKPGLADICRESKRIKEFRLSDAIVYSYCKDNRFVLFICILLGFTIWWGVAPEPLLLKPEALSSPDLKLLVKVVKDTFLFRVCSSHPHVSSPCDCGEPLNNLAKELFEEPPYDPIDLSKTSRSIRLKAISFFIGTCILALTLGESVSQHGVYLNLREFDFHSLMKA